MSSTEDNTSAYTLKKKSKKARHKVSISKGFSTRSPNPPIPVDVDKQPASLMKLAAKLSLDTGSYVDTRFLLFSRRKSSGVVFAPRAVFANSWLLRARLPAYFEPLLRGGYDGDSVEGPLDAVPQEFPKETTTYDYNDDSDLEEEDEEEGFGVFFSKAEPTELEPSSSEVKVEDEEPANSGSTGRGLGTTGQTIMMKNHAYTTWKAFIYYLYTGDVTFAPLKSQLKTRPSADATQRQVLALTAPPCSPKSMYRLADELGFEELKRKAQSDISGKLTPENILDELFSTLPCRYDAIRDIEVGYACNSARHVVVNQFPSYIASMGPEDLKRCSDIISLLVTRLAQR